jgi:FtsZ-binding cell division protein ZapB
MTHRRWATVEAELEASARRLETENSTLLRGRIEELTAKNQKLRQIEKANANLLRERIKDLTAKNQKLQSSPLSSFPSNEV